MFLRRGTYHLNKSVLGYTPMPIVYKSHSPRVVLPQFCRSRGISRKLTFASALFRHRNQARALAGSSNVGNNDLESNPDDRFGNTSLRTTDVFNYSPTKGASKPFLRAYDNVLFECRYIYCWGAQKVLRIRRSADALYFLNF